jgi:methionyl-tRNA synthetase
MSYKRHLITSALPYANGPLHFGHLGGVYLPADIYRRHRELQGHEVVHVCGSDEHGVAIMIAAEKKGESYQDYVNHWHKAHKALFSAYEIEFTVFGRTSAPYHARETTIWFQRLYENGFIGKKGEKQLYSIDDGKFLPDRYVEGTCYNCGYAHARGDECPNCGEWIESTRLINPVSKISGSRNIEIRETEHYYLLLSKMEAQFRQWFGTKEGVWRNLVTGFVKGLLDQGLIDRAISRDLNWGIDVPLPDAQGKKLYVWFDAPIGYVSNLREHLGDEAKFNSWWNSDDVEISHFIGKDNIIFHAVIWPCMIMGSQRVHLPTQIPANQFVNLEGKQFSKSGGWYVDAQKALDAIGPDALRFYLCSIIPENSDSNFSWDAFKVAHSDLSNKIGNLFHRCLTFVQKNWPEGLPAAAFQALQGTPDLAEMDRLQKAVLTELDGYHFGKALQELLVIGNKGNEFFHSAEPWKQIKVDREAAARSCAMALTFSGTIGALLQPLVPGISRRMLAYFDLGEDLTRAIYNQGSGPLVAHLAREGFRTNLPAQVLVPRIEDEVIDKLKEEMSST